MARKGGTPLKQNTRFRECYTCFGCEAKTEVVYVFWSFFNIDQYSAKSFKRSRRDLSIDVAEHRYILKSKGVMVFWLFFKIGLCSAISFKRTRRELSIDVAEHKSMSYEYQNTYYPHTQPSFSHPKQIWHSLTRVFCFYSEHKSWKIPPLNLTAKPSLVMKTLSFQGKLV